MMQQNWIVMLYTIVISNLVWIFQSQTWKHKKPQIFISVLGPENGMFCVKLLQ